MAEAIARIAERRLLCPSMSDAQYYWWRGVVGAVGGFWRANAGGGWRYETTGRWRCEDAAAEAAAVTCDGVPGEAEDVFSILEIRDGCMMA